MEYRVSSNLATENITQAAILAAAAFADTPSYKDMCGDSSLSERRAFLAWLFKKNFELRSNHKAFRCTYDDNRLISFFMFTPPGSPDPTLCDMICAGLVTGLWTYGLTTVKRLLATKSWFENREREILGKRYGTLIRLERMAVLPEYQGKGVGSFALSAALREADVSGLACILGTQENRNVIFYKRLGFEIVDESMVSIDGSSYTNWFMIREPIRNIK